VRAQARIAPGYPHGLNVHVVEVILILAGMPGPLLAMARVRARWAARQVAAGSCGRLAERPGTAARGPPRTGQRPAFEVPFY